MDLNDLIKTRARDCALRIGFSRGRRLHTVGSVEECAFCSEAVPIIAKAMRELVAEALRDAMKSLCQLPESAIAHDNPFYEGVAQGHKNATVIVQNLIGALKGGA